MAIQAGNVAAALPAAANVVGNAFVNQYYNVLHQSPQVVHRFYTDASRLTRAEAGAVDIVSTQNDIHDKVMSSDYSEFKAEIKTVDSQDSLTGGVLVLVSGSLSTKSNGKRNFVQSFFLAPQEKGYFVLNDIFRYLDEESQQTKSAPYLSNGTVEPEPLHQNAPEPEVAEPAVVTEPEIKEITSPPMSENGATIEEVVEHPETVDAEEEEHDGPTPLEVHMDSSAPVIEEPESPMVQPAPTQVAQDPESPMVQPAPTQVAQDPESPGDQPKKSYASILKVLGSTPKVSQPVSERSAVSSSSSPASATPPQENVDEGTPVEVEADGRSVYVKNLPMGITAAQLEEEFVKFGPVKAGGVNVKIVKAGVCFAFVEFEDSSAARSAIEASPVSVGGRQVYIEEKRPMGRAPRRVNEGRSDRPYRGDRNDRTEGGRGRGSYGGGRNFGRAPGPDSRERDGNNRGGRASGGSRGGYPSSGSTGASANNNSGYERRFDGQRAPRRNSGAAQAPRSNGTPAVAAV